MALSPHLVLRLLKDNLRQATATVFLGLSSGRMGAVLCMAGAAGGTLSRARLCACVSLQESERRKVAEESRAVTLVGPLNPLLCSPPPSPWLASPSVARLVVYPQGSGIPGFPCSGPEQETLRLLILSGTPRSPVPAQPGLTLSSHTYCPLLTESEVEPSGRLLKERSSDWNNVQYRGGVCVVGVSCWPY